MTDSWQFRAVVDASINPPTVTVGGDVDTACSANLRAVLTSAGAARQALTVDLRAVTHFDSSAVQVLFDIAATTDLTLIVLADHVVTRLISLTGLNTVTTVVVSASNG